MYSFTVKGTAIMKDGKRENIVVHDYQSSNRYPSESELRGVIDRRANHLEWGVLGTVVEITNISFDFVRDLSQR